MDVKQIRLSSGLSQKAFCLRYLIPLKTLQNWEAPEGSPSFRACPPYVTLLLEKAVREDFPLCSKLLDADIDSSHLKAIKLALSRIKKSPLSKYVKDVYLYGSTARGTYRNTSDIDILLVLDEAVKERKQYGKWITYLKGNISSDDFCMPEADLHVVYGEDWKDKTDTYFTNVKKEGFSLWN
ncbi:MAG: nucleotidyltransferase domain-containing protein [Sphaerochaetaceae bacterium]|nr:nucleotidyltransferase domain-containing protein [Sphaerochaetaceae bacterium]